MKDNDKASKEKKWRLRKWKMLELVELDADDDDFEEAVEIGFKKKARPARKVKPRKIEGESASTAIAEMMPFSPELDTVRVYFDCSSFIDLDLYIPNTATKTLRCAMRTPMGDIYHDHEFYRNEMRCSWYGKMQISKEQKQFGRNGRYSRSVLSFEYSVAKWWHYASAVNSGEEPSAELLLAPCCQAMQATEIEKYSSVSLHRIFELFLERAEIRRFDLSLNFKVPMNYRPVDYINILAQCHLNRQDARREGVGSISFGTEKSPYRTIWYDKEEEAKVYYTRCEKFPQIVYYEDKEGNTYKTYVPGCVEKVFDLNREKKNFYEKNKDKFRNNIRFEVQFRTKFMQEHNLMTQGKENIDNVIRLGVFYWRDLLDQFDEQLSRANFEYKDSDKEPVANALETIDERQEAEVYSRTQASNMKCFIIDCYRKGWKVVRDKMGSASFCMKRKTILEELDYDVKVALPERLPIMRIMSSYLVSREGRMVKDFRFVPAPVEHLAV